ncbi:hypothetical protein OH77DRAFT_1525721 [Trametes cingulata]|nr:hypothetical protein OH77DRAFT_1525721 [Trametes cingulata]
MDRPHPPYPDQTFRGFSSRAPGAAFPVDPRTLGTPTRIQVPVPSHLLAQDLPGDTTTWSPPPISARSSLNNPFVQCTPELLGDPGQGQPPPPPVPPGTPSHPPPFPPPQPPPVDPTTQLARAIQLLAQTLQRPAPTASPMGAPREKDNVRDPNPFDGSDLNKLCAFFAQLELVFKARPRTFDSDERKVTYALSYLKGTALQWYEPYLLEGYSDDPPLFLYSYEAFQD